MSKDIQDGQSITTNLSDVIPKGMTLKKVFNHNRLIIKSFTVKGILGLDTTVNFDDHITSLTSLGSQGRTRFLRCLHAFRIMCICNNYDMQPDMIYDKVDGHSRMSMTVTTANPDDRDFSMTVDIEFIKRHSDRTDDDYYLNAITWTLYDCDGEWVHYDDIHDPEYVDDFYDYAIAEVKRFLDHGIVQTMDEAMSYLGGLPYDILSIIGVHDPSDISANIGRLIPWLCVFADATMNRTIILDDVFDSIHPCVVMNMTEKIDSQCSLGRRQMVMSCRRPEGLVDDSACYVFNDGKAVRVSRESPHERLYLFDDKDSNTLTRWIEHVKDGSVFQKVNDIMEVGQ